MFLSLQLECKLLEASHIHLSTSSAQSNDQPWVSISELMCRPEYQMPHGAFYVGDAPNSCAVCENEPLCALVFSVPGRCSKGTSCICSFITRLSQCLKPCCHIKKQCLPFPLNPQRVCRMNTDESQPLLAALQEEGPQNGGVFYWKGHQWR